MKFILLLLVVTTSNLLSYCQLSNSYSNGNTPNSKGIWSHLHNVAGVSYSQKKALLLSHNSKYGLSELSQSTIALIFPNKLFVVSGSFFTIGDEYLKEQQFSVGFSRKY